MGFVDNRIVLATNLLAEDCTEFAAPVSGPLYDLGPARSGSYAPALAGMWLVVNCTLPLTSVSAGQRLAIGVSTVATDAQPDELVAAPSLWQYGNIDTNTTATQHRGLAPGTAVGQLFAIPMPIVGSAFTLNRYLGFWMSLAGSTGGDGGTLNRFNGGALSAYLTTSIPTNLRHMPDGIA